MNYEKHYNFLISRSKTRILEGYSEKHHIVPRCMGGTNDAENLVQLTAEEHYVAHQLLVKMYPNIPGLVYAAKAMTVSNHRVDRVTNKLYGWLRKRHAIAVSETHKGKPKSEEHRRKISKALTGRNRGPQSNEWKRKRSESMSGRTLSDEHRQKISEALKGNQCARKNKEKINS